MAVRNARFSGYNEVGFNNASRGLHTPNLDRLAAEGIVLDSYCAYMECSPAHSLHSSVYFLATTRRQQRLHHCQHFRCRLLPLLLMHNLRRYTGIYNAKKTMFHGRCPTNVLAYSIGDDVRSVYNPAWDTGQYVGGERPMGHQSQRNLLASKFTGRWLPNCNVGQGVNRCRKILLYSTILLLD